VITLDTIRSERLDLVTLSAEFLEACLNRDLRAAVRILGLEIPDQWMEKIGLMRMRLDQLLEDETALPWVTRALVLRSEQTMIGHAGFHGKPGADHLRGYGANVAEFGYTVYPEFRRNGYALEASIALMEWASRVHGVSQFAVSIRPLNAPSLSLARKLGFFRVGSQIDEIDGREDVFLLDYSPPSRLPSDEVTGA